MVLCCTFVRDGNRGVKQSCGAYDSTLEPGCHAYCCPLQTISDVSIRVRQVDVVTDTKTQDSVTVQVRTSVLYQVRDDGVYDAYFKLVDEKRQMSSYVDDVVRSELPQLTLDDAYAAKSSMANNVLEALQEAMLQFGLSIKKVLVVDLQPDGKVMHAMNEINTQKRQRAAAQEKAEADKILKVKAAEADMEAKHLSGQGVARMRKAITNGFKESIETMREEVGIEAHEVVHMMLTTQYLDTMNHFASSGATAVMVCNTSEGDPCSQGGMPSPPERKMAPPAQQVEFLQQANRMKSVHAGDILGTGFESEEEEAQDAEVKALIAAEDAAEGEGEPVVML